MVKKEKKREYNLAGESAHVGDSTPTLGTRETPTCTVVESCAVCRRGEVQQQYSPVLSDLQGRGTLYYCMVLSRARLCKHASGAHTHIYICILYACSFFAQQGSSTTTSLAPSPHRTYMRTHTHLYNAHTYAGGKEKRVHTPPSSEYLRVFSYMYTYIRDYCPVYTLALNFITR